MSSVRDLIFDRMATALDAVSGIERVYRARETTFDQHDTKALKLVDRGDAMLRALTHYENRAGFEIRLLERDYDENALRDTLSDLRASIETALNNGEFWTDLAVETTVRASDEVQGDATNPAGLLVMDGEVLYRVALNDPSKVVVL